MSFAIPFLQHQLELIKQELEEIKKQVAEESTTTEVKK